MKWNKCQGTFFKSVCHAPQMAYQEESWEPQNVGELTSHPGTGKLHCSLEGHNFKESASSCSEEFRTGHAAS